MTILGRQFFFKLGNFEKVSYNFAHLSITFISVRQNFNNFILHRTVLLVPK